MARTTFNGDKSNPLVWIISLLLLTALAYLAVAYMFGYKPFEKSEPANNSIRSSIRNEASSTMSSVNSVASSTVSSAQSQAASVKSSVENTLSSVSSSINQ